MANRLTGQVAVITGSGGGIGSEIALAKVSEGAKIVVNDIGVDDNGKKSADITLDRIKKAGGTAVANYDNISTMAGGENLIKTAISNFGKIDILVNCAGYSITSTAVDTTEAEWDDMVAANLKSQFACSQPAIKEMLKQKSGRIINFSSSAGFASGKWMGFGCLPYSAAKAGVVGLTNQLASELMDDGITVNAILPAADTKGFPIPPGIKPRIEIKGPEFVAPFIVYLATDEAKDITGKFFFVTGGEIILFAHPLNPPGPNNKPLHKDGKWTVDELIEVIPPLFNE